MTLSPFPFGLPTASHPSRARLRYNQIVGRPIPISTGWNPSAGASGALARRGALCVRGGWGRISPVSKNDFLRIQRKFFEPLFLSRQVGQIVPLPKLSHP
jgi:hypothetical protein